MSKLNTKTHTQTPFERLNHKEPDYGMIEIVGSDGVTKKKIDAGEYLKSKKL